MEEDVEGLITLKTRQLLTWLVLFIHTSPTQKARGRLRNLLRLFAALYIYG